MQLTLILLKLIWQLPFLCVLQPNEILKDIAVNKYHTSATQKGVNKEPFLYYLVELGRLVILSFSQYINLLIVVTQPRARALTVVLTVIYEQFCLSGQCFTGVSL